ncbi:MAG: hypothetical protein L6R37_002622 [Teloschistes peruensis]|nr:MAG: hypothetical protein L6R37_002622 [Teloschistes peruensis]
MAEKGIPQLIDEPVGPPVIYPWFDMCKLLVEVVLNWAALTLYQAWRGPVLDANGRVTKEIKGEPIGPSWTAL